MRVIKAHNQDDIERLKPVALEWKETCNGETLGINLAPETYYADLANLLHKPNAALFIPVYLLWPGAFSLLPGPLGSWPGGIVLCGW